MSSDATLNAHIIKISIEKLKTIIHPQEFYFIATFIFKLYFPIFNFLESIRLFFQQIDLDTPRVKSMTDKKY